MSPAETLSVAAATQGGGAAPRASDDGGCLRRALGVLGVRRFVLAIHDQSFPSTSAEDIGRGSPYGQGARDLLAFVAGLGFDGVQLGPQGDTTVDNPSPYDGALFTRSPMSIALATLVDDPLWEPLAAGLLERKAAPQAGQDADRVRYRQAWRTAREVLAALHARFSAERGRFAALADKFGNFQRDNATWLESEGLYEALVAEWGTDDWRLWAEQDRSLSSLTPARRSWLRETRASEMERHAFGQFVIEEQHQALRRAIAGTGSASTLALFGDLPIGFSHRDLWSQGALFLRDYVMGAPPSRTNPDGQPWGFPVLDPDQLYAEPAGRTSERGPVLRLLVARVDRILRDFDGLRIDHPHGLVCPWVYAAGDPDPAAAVSRGARLLCSPHLPDHPALQRLAVPTEDQLSADPGIARYADDWVRDLRDDQVTRYAVLFDAIMDRVHAAGRRPSDVVCEVLSTWPYPLRRVMERYDLGRFCVLQKADLTRSTDVYRAENVSPRDWIMVGNHDTRPIWALADSWHGTAAGAQWASYLAERLIPVPAPTADGQPPSTPTADAHRVRLARWLSLDARHLCHGMFAALFASRAAHVSVFFADLFGLREVYNRPGTVDAENWTLRLPTDWRQRHDLRLQGLDALNLPLSLALAMLSLPPPGPPGLADLRIELLSLARAQTPLLEPDITALLDVSPGGSGRG